MLTEKIEKTFSPFWKGGNKVKRDKISKLKVEISGIPQEWVPRSIERWLARSESRVSVGVKGITRTLIFEVGEFLINHFGVGKSR